jgi:mRNA interferase HigB
VNVIARRTLQGYVAEHPEAAAPLQRWFVCAKKAHWKCLHDVRLVLPGADQVGDLLIFAILHGRYRLIVKADFHYLTLFIKALLTHKEYDRGGWKSWAR